MTSDGESEDRAAPLPWRRLAGLLRPIRGGLAGMVGLSTGGVLIGLVPPLALGALVNALVEHNDKAEAGLLAGLIALAISVETVAYVLSDGMFARNAGRLYRCLRLEMFEGARRRPSIDEDEQSGLPSRFISDAETVGSPCRSWIVGRCCSSSSRVRSSCSACCHRGLSRSLLRSSC